MIGINEGLDKRLSRAIEVTGLISKSKTGIMFRNYLSSMTNLLGSLKAERQVFLKKLNQLPLLQNHPPLEENKGVTVAGIEEIFLGQQENVR